MHAKGKKIKSQQVRDSAPDFFSGLLRIFSDPTAAHVPHQGPQCFGGSGVLSMMQDDSVLVGDVISVVASRMSKEIFERDREILLCRREIEALASAQILLEAKVRDLQAAYISEEPNQIIRRLRSCLEEQQAAIQYHLAMSKRAEDRGGHGTLKHGVLEELEATVQDEKTLSLLRDALLEEAKLSAHEDGASTVVRTDATCSKRQVPNLTLR